MAEVAQTIGAISQRMQNTSNSPTGLVPEVQLVPIDSSGNVNAELSLGAMPSLATTMDFGTAGCGYLFRKVLYLSVTTQFTWVTSGNVTAQLFVGRTTASASDSTHPLIGSAANLLSANGTSLAVGLYVLTPNGLWTPSWTGSTSTFPELNNPHPFVGLRLVFPSAPSAGVAAAYIETTPA